MKGIKLGIYRHFKGSECKVIGLAKDSETLEEMVVYIHLGEDSFGNKGSMWVRPLSMFLETIERDGKKIKRFTYIRKA
jgi:hypothetical protein